MLVEILVEDDDRFDLVSRHAVPAPGPLLVEKELVQRRVIYDDRIPIVLDEGNHALDAGHGAGVFCGLFFDVDAARLYGKHGVLRAPAKPARC